MNAGSSREQKKKEKVQQTSERPKRPNENFAMVRSFLRGTNSGLALRRQCQEYHVAECWKFQGAQKKKKVQQEGNELTREPGLANTGQEIGQRKCWDNPDTA